MEMGVLSYPPRWVWEYSADGDNSHIIMAVEDKEEQESETLNHTSFIDRRDWRGNEISDLEAQGIDLKTEQESQYRMNR